MAIGGRMKEFVGREKGLTVRLVEMDARQTFKIAGIKVRRWWNICVKKNECRDVN